MKEIEVKILDVKVEEVKRTLGCIGATQQWEGLQKIWVFDIPTLFGRVHELNQMLKMNQTDWRVLRKKAENIVAEIKNSRLYSEISANIGCVDLRLSGEELRRNLLRVFENEQLLSILKEYGTSPNKWIRVRSDPNCNTITVKEIVFDQSTIQNVEEYEAVIEDADEIIDILKQFGIIHRNYQEKYRVSYRLGDIKIEVDSWPLIPPYIEIEAPTEEELQFVLDKMKSVLVDNKIVSCNTADIYELYGLDIYQYAELKF